jgi:UDP-N-acetylmuramoylalanine--D-glutamate ligase
MDISNKKRFFVLGLGKSGLAVARLLSEKGYAVTIFDDDAGTLERVGREMAGAANTARGENVLEHLVASDCLVVSPGVPDEHPIVRKARTDGIEVTGELEIAYHFCESKIIGVTGTNGKSTVVKLIGHILETAGVPSVVAGNIGTPLSAVVREESVPGTIVLEISSFQLDTIDEFHADIAVLLNVTPDHLDRYRSSFDDYVESKSRILNRATRDTVFVYNDDDPACRSIASRFDGTKIGFSSTRRLDHGVYLSSGSIVRKMTGDAEPVMKASEFAPVGVHNLENAMAAIASVTPLGLDSESVRTALKTYEPLPHRMEVVAEIRGVVYINDSKATNVDAALKSIQSIEGPVTVIMGGLDKDGDFTSMRGKLKNVNGVILIGKASEVIADALTGFVDLQRADTLEEAVRMAALGAREGDTVLLAPACASFDMFDNYAHRGETFRQAVEEL